MARDKAEEIISVYNTKSLLSQFEKFGLFLRPGTRLNLRDRDLWFVGYY